MRNFYFLEKKSWREGKEIKRESCLQPTFACNPPTRFFFGGRGFGFAQISCSELLELVRNQESTWKLGTKSSSNNKEGRRTHTIIIKTTITTKERGKKKATRSFVGTHCPINDDVYVYQAHEQKSLPHPTHTHTHTHKYTCCIHTDLCCMYTNIYGIWLSIEDHWLLGLVMHVLGL